MVFICLISCLYCRFLSCTYAFQSESTLCSCMNVKELLARSRCEIWRWSDCNCTRTQNHLVLKGTLNHLAKLGAEYLFVRYFEYLFVRSIWLYALVMSRTRFRVNPNSIAARMSRNSLLKADAKCGFTLKHVRGMTRTYSQIRCTDKYSERSSKFGQFGQMVECLFKN